MPRRRESAFAGELCFCAETGGTRHTVARACTEVTVLEISYAAFLEYLRAAEAVLSSLLCTMCIRPSDCETRTQILSYRGAQERLGRLLLQLATRARTKPRAAKGDEYSTLRLSHAEVAGMAAMSRAHVTVTLGYFREKELIQYSRNRPITVNVRKLRALVSAQ